MLAHLYVGALVASAALLAISLLVGTRAPQSGRALRTWGAAAGGFGIVAIALRIFGLASNSIVIVGAAAGTALICGLAMRKL